MKTILLATTNQGKAQEMLDYLADLPFEFKTLSDFPDLEPPEEKYDDIMYNAQLKALYYAEKTGLPSIADDTGFYIDALHGWPGVKAARVADTEEKRIQEVFERLEGITDRSASFRCEVFFHDPEKKRSYSSQGETHGKILDNQVGNSGFGYDPVFFSDELGKSFAQASIQEKAEVSHRGRALSGMKNTLSMMYTSRHTIVPIALIVQDGKLMMTLRNDPQNARFHRKWEFPGGKLDMGETVEECVVRETQEEAGYDVEVIQRLSHVKVVHESTHNYQICLIPCLCRIVGGDGVHRDAEVLEKKYFDLDEVLGLPDLIPENDDLYEKILPELKTLVAKYNL